MRTVKKKIDYLHKTYYILLQHHHTNSYVFLVVNVVFLAAEAAVKSKSKYALFCVINFTFWTKEHNLWNVVRFTLRLLYFHFVKYARIRVFFGRYFAAKGQNLRFYLYKGIFGQRKPVFRHIWRSVYYYIVLLLLYLPLSYFPGTLYFSACSISSML